MSVRLMPFQKTALQKLGSGDILMGGVGSGKSIVGIMWWLTKICECKVGEDRNGKTYLPINDSPNLLIITEAKKRDSLEWEKDLVKFGLHVGKNDDVYILVDSWNNIAKYHDFKGTVIFDEQHASGTGRWAKEFMHIARNCGRGWILMSATPSDTYMDLLPIFLVHGFYRNKTQFYNRHVIFDRWVHYPKIKEWRDTEHLDNLRNSITVVMKRPENLGPTRLPESRILCRYDAEAVQRLRKDRINPYSGEPVLNASEYCFCMRRIINSDDTRVVEIMRILNEHPKVIIFYNYDFELEMLRGLRKRFGITLAEYNGHRHDDIPETDSWAYLVNYGSGSEAWNCTSTDTIIFFSANYSYRIMEQAMGRIDRVNSKYAFLNYFLLETTSAIDRRIDDTLRQKGRFNEKIFMEKEDGK